MPLTRFGYIPHSVTVNNLAFNSTTDTNGGAIVIEYAYALPVTQTQVDAGFLETRMESGKLYIFDGPINMNGHQITVPAGGLHVTGHGFGVTSLTLTDENKAMFISPAGGSGDLFLSEMTVTSSGTGGSVFALDDADGTHAFELTHVNFNGCTSLGFLDGYRQGLEENTGRFGGTPGLEFRGAWNGGYFIFASITRGLTNSVFSVYKSAVGQTFASRVGGNPNMDLPANVTGFEVAAANFSDDEEFQLTGANFQGAGTPLSGLSVSDVKTRISSSRGIDSTHVGGYWTITASAETPTTTNDVFVKLAGTTAYTDLAWFSGPGNND